MFNCDFSDTSIDSPNPMPQSSPAEDSDIKEADISAQPPSSSSSVPKRKVHFADSVSEILEYPHCKRDNARLRVTEYNDVYCDDGTEIQCSIAPATDEYPNDHIFFTEDYLLANQDPIEDALYSQEQDQILQLDDYYDLDTSRMTSSERCDLEFKKSQCIDLAHRFYQARYDHYVDKYGSSKVYGTSTINTVLLNQEASDVADPGEDEVQVLLTETGISAYRDPSKEELKEFSHEFDQAKLNEIQSWQQNGVFEVIPEFSPDEMTNVIDGRWLIKVKTNSQQEIVKFKARLVTRGFKDMQKEDVLKDSPTANRISVRLLLNYAISSDYRILSADIKTAFLQGDRFQDSEHRNIYFRPPKHTNALLGQPESAYWLLKKPVYGLVDAPRRFYDALARCLTEDIGLRRCPVDFALFIMITDGKTTGIVVSHVDDLLITGTPEFINHLTTKLEQKFSFGKLSDKSFDYIGSVITAIPADDKHPTARIAISQKHYVDTFDIPSLPPGYSDTDDLYRDEYKQYRNLLGKLGWISLNTRPDLSFMSNMLSQHQVTPKVVHYKLLKKAVKTAKNFSKRTLSFVPLQGNQLFLACFSDASHKTNKETMTSQTGFAIFLCCLDGPTKSVTANLLDWTSVKQKRVTRSTLSAETLACTDTMDKAKSIQSLYESMFQLKLPILVFLDNYSLVSTSSLTTKVRECELTVDLAIIRENVQKQLVHLYFVPTNIQLADPLTKSMSADSLVQTVHSHRFPELINEIVVRHFSD